MENLLISSLFVFVAYVLSMLALFGVPASISDTYYQLNKKDHGSGCLFTLALLGMALPLMPVFIELGSLKENSQFLAFLSCAALCFVAVAPNFKSGMDRKVHICATAICALSSQIWVGLFVPWLLLLWMVPAAGLSYKIIKNYRERKKDEKIGVKLYYRKPLFDGCNVLFWVEVTAFLVTYIALFYVHNHML